MSKQAGIIDYGAGNLSSVCNSFQANGEGVQLVRSSADLAGITHLVLPGVGAFGDCARALQAQGLQDPIREWIAADRPFLGICIGYQILFESGDESPGTQGLGVFGGHVGRFPAGGLKVPHMGWNTVHPTDPLDPLFAGLGEAPYFYFVHSYHPTPAQRQIISATTTYGHPFASAVRRGNVVGTQFHPEKSQRNGLALLANFMKMG